MDMDIDAEDFQNEDATPPSEESGCWLLDKILIENFKSYKNLVRIEALQTFPFIAIIGPNGSGKYYLSFSCEWMHWAFCFIFGMRADVMSNL